MQLNVSRQIILLDPDLPDRAEAASSLCMDKVRSLWLPGPPGCPFRCFSVLYTSDCRSSNNKPITFSEEFSAVDCDYNWSSEYFSTGTWITRQQNVSKIKEGRGALLQSWPRCVWQWVEVKCRDVYAGFTTLCLAVSRGKVKCECRVYHTGVWHCSSHCGAEYPDRAEETLGYTAPVTSHHHCHYYCH